MQDRRHARSYDQRGVAVKALTIEIAEGNYFDLVDWYGRRSGGLCWDELLGAVAEITHPTLGASRLRMETEDETAARAALRDPVRLIANFTAPADPATTKGKWK